MAPEEENPDLQSLTMLRLETGIAFLLTLFSAGLSLFMPQLVQSGGIVAAQSFITLSPVFFPRLAFALLAIMGLSYFLKSVRQLSGPSASPVLDRSDRFLRAGLMLLVVVIYALLVSSLGFILSSMLMTLLVSAYLGLTNPLALCSVTVVIPILIRFIFERLLLISLPRSEFELIAGMEDALMKFLSTILLVG
jgi:hypothetical protein